MTWYQNWFNTPYYHILYKQRNFEEAAEFIDSILNFIKPAPSAKFLDVACGRGRHAIYLNKKGFDVTGIDISDASISEANKFKNEKLQFIVHDMRNVFKHNHFNYALNLFTSFGYFNNDEENNVAIQSIAAGLKQDGMLVIDFINSKKAMNQLICSEQKNMEGITFDISKKIENGFFVKNISFKHGDKNFEFQEKVQALMPEDFKRYFNQNGLKMIHLFGDYRLNEFDENSSDRLIMLVKKSTDI